VAGLAARADAGERAAVDALDAAGHWLGVALGSAANLLDPQAFVLGGFLAQLAPHLRPAAEVELKARVLGARRALPDVLTSPLGPEAASRGAAVLALRGVLDDPGRLGEG
jgi:predicted NBD/HSP70 family sugar kinase